MPFVDRVITRSSGASEIAALPSLHRELTLLGVPVAPSEETQRNFGEFTEAAVRSFQLRAGLRETGEVDPTTGGIMALAVLATDEGDRARSSGRSCAARSIACPIRRTTTTG